MGKTAILPDHAAIRIEDAKRAMRMTRAAEGDRATMRGVR